MGCEMNKFDDMMAYLQTSSPGFCQVVALDVDLVLFSRIWCIAELMEASRSQIPQSVKILSDACVNVHLDDLQRLDVRDAQASIPSDRDHILSKVKDPDGFNVELRDLILRPKTGILSVLTNGHTSGSRLHDSAQQALHVAVEEIVRASAIG